MARAVEIKVAASGGSIPGALAQTALPTMVPIAGVDGWERPW
jgi:hypothetical protein